MSSLFAEKKPDTNSRSVANQLTDNKISGMAAVPALQRMEVPEDELQMKPAQLKKDTIQKQGDGEEEELLQGKFIIQKQVAPEEEEPMQMKAFQLKSGTVQKEGIPEEEMLQKKPFQLKADTIQKAGLPEEELPVQGKFEPVQKKENKTGLPDNLKSGVEQLSGHSLDDVSVHYNSSQPAQLNALAYAQGTDIHVGPGQEQHLPHEAWHVAQQKQGRVQPTMQMKAGLAVNDDPGLENEADTMGAKAVQMKEYPQAKPTIASNAVPAKSTVQRQIISNQEITRWISWASGISEPNKKAILLNIYNQIRLDVDPNPEIFTGLPAAQRALINAGKIDAEDVEKLEAKAALRQQAAGNHGELVRLQTRKTIESKYDAVDGAYGHHIFNGDFSGETPTGYHSIIDGSDTHEAYGTKTNIANGVYQQSVRSSEDTTKKKKNQSTFFPDNATHEQIIEGIASVYEAGLSQIGHVHANVNGIKLEKRGNTIYPAGGSDSLLAE